MNSSKALGDNIPVILHIEDDDGDARMVARTIAKLPCEVKLERMVDGREAMTAVDSIGHGKRPVPALILLDLKLPYASGKEVLERARSYDSLAEVPVVILTSSAVDHDRHSCKELGCTEYLVKPMDYFDFQNVVRGACLKYVPGCMETSSAKA